MAIKKESLNNFLPDGFETLNQEGYKENFSADKISTGYEKDVPELISGPNLNNLIDVIGKNTNTLNSYVEYLNSLSVNKTPIVDSNNQLNSTQIGLKVYSATETYLLNDLVTTIQDGKVHFYRSLVANNTGHDLTDEQYWEEVKLGGAGLEICDIGMSLFVDETKGLRRYLNGQIVDINTNTQAFLNRLKDITTLHPSLLCTEDEWQTAKTMSAFGQVGKFVFNYSGDAIVSVRLPRVVNVQGLFDLQNLGMTVGAGLPNITSGNLGYARSGANIDGSGALRNTGKGMYPEGAASNKFWSGTMNFDASRSNPIYGKSTTVQPEAIQYPYFIQIATGSETENNIINEIELNNPYSLFDSKYSDHELNNLSWLKSEGQWNSKAVYTDAYDKLLKVYNGTETVEGLSVKLSTEEYTDYDFVLNTAEETFRLPLKTLHSDDTVDSLLLYFYVGETVQNANLIDAGRIGEQVANCITRNDCKAYITETYKNGSSWYRIYSDGWCEQGGYFTAVSNDLPTNVVSFLKKFTNTKYFVAFTNDRTGTTSNTTSQNFNTMGVRDKKTNSFTFWCSTVQALNGACWEARGYLAQGEY